MERSEVVEMLSRYARTKSLVTVIQGEIREALTINKEVAVYPIKRLKKANKELSEAYSELEQIIDSLDYPHADVIRERFMILEPFGHLPTFKMISERLFFSTSYVKKIYAEALNRIALRNDTKMILKS